VAGQVIGAVIKLPLIQGESMSNLDLHTGSAPGRRLPALALAALGVVFGSVGTAPLFALKAIFAGTHPIPVSEANILGSLSLFVWALIIVVSVKYTIFIMRADNSGEGGIMALISLALRAVHGKPKQVRTVVVIGIVGAALFFVCGMVTPAISVLSAVEGLKVATPALEPVVIPITLAVLFILFYVQRHGTALVDRFVGPVMLLWFASLALLGVNAIVAHPGVLMALNPASAVGFVVDHRLLALVALGCAALTVAGAEALHAGMGQFGRNPVRGAWFAVVLPALVLNYLGQGALLLDDAAAARNPFFLLAPGWVLLPLVALATSVAAIVSQAAISAASSVTRQAIMLGFVPRMEVQRTADMGQFYLPVVNWGMLLAVMLLVLGIRSSDNLVDPFGIVVSGQMMITSLLSAAIVARGWGWIKAGVLFGGFLAIELAFLVANLLNLSQGGWLLLLTAGAIFIAMATWKQGRVLHTARIRSERLELSMFLESLAASMPTRVGGTSVFLNADVRAVPHALLHNLMHNKVLHERVVVVAAQFSDVPSVPDASRVKVRKLRDNFWSVSILFGFKDDPDIPRALSLCASSGLEFDALETTYFIGRETLYPRFHSEMAFWRERIFVAMYRNAGSPTAFFRIPSNRVVELGAQVTL
jgi:KUP system potassium uptake protein